MSGKERRKQNSTTARLIGVSILSVVMALTGVLIVVAGLVTIKSRTGLEKLVEA
jgi:hypothetical protein